MQISLFAVRMALRELLVCDEGQDLVEYALVVALIALGATAGMNALATDINNAFSSVGSLLNNNV